MKNILLITNTILCFYFILYSIKNLRESTILNLSILTFSLMYSIGFLIIIFYPNVFLEDYLRPNYDFSYTFSIPKNDKPLYALTSIQSGLLFGIILSKKITFNHPNILKNTIYIDKKYSLIFGALLLIISYLYFILFFYNDPSWPLLNYLKFSTDPSMVSCTWGAIQQNKSFIFYISIMRQFLQIVMPLAGFYLLIYYYKSKNYLVLVITIIHFSIFFLLIVGLLKSTPIVLFCIELFIFGIIQKPLNKKIILISILLSCIGYYNNTLMRHFYLPSLELKKSLNKGDSSQLYTELQVSDTENKNYNQYDMFAQHCADYFKSGKIKIDFSENEQKKLKEYVNKIRHLNKTNLLYSTFIARLIGRVLVGEMMDTFMIVGNEELTTYYKNNEPLLGYVKKILGSNQMTIYQQFAKILLGDLTAGSITVSFFFELFLLCGKFSVLLITLFIFSLSLLDKLIFNQDNIKMSTNQRIFVDPSLAFLTVMIPMMGLKGFMVSFFTGGFLTLLAWLTFKSIFLYYLFPKRINSDIS